jgi:hypothetical protein
MSALIPQPTPPASDLSLDDLAQMPPFDQALFLLADTFGFDLTPIASLRYTRALADIPDALIVRAANHLLATRERYMPNPAEIRTAAMQVATADERAQLAFTAGPVRAALLAGMLPANWTHERYVSVCAALSVPESPHAASFYADEEE